jgi:TRIAP1/MDM35 family protein
MAQSLSAECTPLKIKYDLCFNAWLESYLSPEVTSAVNTSTTKDSANDDSRAQRNRKMAQGYEDKCGEAWKAYNACVIVSLVDTILDCGSLTVFRTESSQGA